MDYEGLIIRPPSEAYSLLLQVTVGCLHNRRTFCGTYCQKKFKIKSIERIEKVPHTPLYDDYRAGRFILPDKMGFIRELYLMIANSNFTDCYFTSNHASNYLPIKSRLPKQKEKTLKMISAVIDEKDESRMRPEYLRGL